MYSEKPFFTKLIMSGLTTMLTLVSACCNGFVIAVVARFKSLRTVPNILLSNHALADLVNAIICVPLYMMYTVLEASWFRGKTLAIMTSFFDRVYIAINLTSLLAMIVNILLAISYDMKYKVWKSNRKALLCVFLIWLIGIVFVSIPLLNIDIGNAYVTEYRAVIYEQGKYFVASFMALFIISVAILGFLTTRAIKSRRKEVIKWPIPGQLSAHYICLSWRRFLKGIMVKSLINIPCKTKATRSLFVHWDHQLVY